MSAVLVLDEATHTYRIGSRVLPSVTQVIKELYDGAFDWVSDEHLEWKSELGRAVHKACELDDDGVLDESSLEYPVLGYALGWRKFRNEVPISMFMNERQLCSAIYGYAGTVDCAGFKSTGDMNAVLIDRKTVSSLSPVIGVQLAGYEILVREHLARDGWPGAHIKPIERWAVQLKPDGTYHIERYLEPDDAIAFRGCLATFNWKKKWLKQ